MKIYVACLASYNNGVLHGRWIDASSDVDAMRDEVNAMLRESKFPNVTVEHDGEMVQSAEEYAIHDFDGLPSTLGEYCGLDTIAEIVEFVDGSDLDEADAIALLEDQQGNVEYARELAQEFCGKYDSFQDFADELADECLAGGHNSNFARTYFDYEAHARDAKMDMHTIEVSDGVLVFHA